MIGLGSSPDQIDVDGMASLDQIELMVPWIRSTLMGWHSCMDLDEIICPTPYRGTIDEMDSRPNSGDLDSPTKL